MYSILRKAHLNEVHLILGRGQKVPGVRKDDTGIPCVGGLVRAEEGEEASEQRGRTGPLEQHVARSRCAGRGHVSGG